MKTKNAKQLSLIRALGSMLSFTVFCIVLLCLTWIQIIIQLQNDRKQTIGEAVKSNSNLVASLEQSAIRTIEEADLALRLVAAEIERPARENPGVLLEEGLIDVNYFSGLAVFDKNGYVRYSSFIDTASSKRSFADREHFYFHKKGSDQLYIGKPIRSRVIHKDVIALSRALHDAEGKFNGTVAIQVEPSRFTQFYSKANMRKHDLISLISPDGITYARRTGNVESHGEDISKSPLFQHVARDPVGNYHAKDAIRGIPTYFSYRKLADYPMIATVGQSEDDVLADYYKREKREILYGTIFSLIILIFLALVWLAKKQRRSNQSRLLDEQRKYQHELTRQIILAQERERETIGHELHDNVNQVLTSVKLYLELVVKDPNRVGELLPRSISHLTASINELRNLSRILSAPTLGPQSLVDSVNSLIQVFSESTSIKIDFQHQGFIEVLDKDQKLAIYRILQEQLNNIIKHAGATEVKIVLFCSEKQATLIVSDNGKGFDTSQARNGIGLNNISSRARVLGGEMTVNSTPGGGTTVKVVFPTTRSGESLVV